MADKVVDKSNSVRLTWTEYNTLSLTMGIKTSSDILMINLTDTNCDYMPIITDITENISGVDGAKFIKSKFEPRVFDIYAESMPDINYSLSDLAELKSEIAKFMLKAKNEYIELHIEKMGAIIKVKLNGQIELPEQYPNWIGFHFPFIAYDDITFHDATDRVFKQSAGQIKIVNSGELDIFPFFELNGALTNPSLIVNDTVYTYNGVIKDGEVVIIDNENQEAYVNNPDGTRTSKNGEWCGWYCSLPIGNNHINIDPSTGLKIAVRWGRRWIAFRR